MASVAASIEVLRRLGASSKSKSPNASLISSKEEALQDLSPREQKRRGNELLSLLSAACLSTLVHVMTAQEGDKVGSLYPKGLRRASRLVGALPSRSSTCARLFEEDGAVQCRLGQGGVAIRHHGERSPPLGDIMSSRLRLGATKASLGYIPAEASCEWDMVHLGLDSKAFGSRLRSQSQWQSAVPQCYSSSDQTLRLNACFLKVQQRMTDSAES